MSKQVGTAAQPGKVSAAVIMGLSEGMVVQELGWDDDVDEALRTEVMDAIDADMVDEALEAVDAVLLWWRDDDGDVADGLVDSMTDLSGKGVIWLMTPKVGRPGYVDPADVADGCTTAGMSLTSTVNISSEWQGHKVVRPKGGRK